MVKKRLKVFGKPVSVASDEAPPPVSYAETTTGPVEDAEITPVPDEQVGTHPRHETPGRGGVFVSDGNGGRYRL